MLYGVIVIFVFHLSVSHVCPTTTKGEFKVNEGCLSLTSVCTTVIILLFTVTHCVTSVAIPLIPYGYTKTPEDMRHPGRQFHHQVKHITVERTACNVTGPLILKFIGPTPYPGNIRNVFKWFKHLQNVFKS